jgi:lysophospholipase L1-like esterase
MKKIFLYAFVFISSIAFAQEYSYFDFGNSANTTAGNWNNVVITTQNQEGLTFNVINVEGTTTGAVFTLTDSFDFINSNGTSAPNGALPFPTSASRDSFFGATDAGFNGNVNPTGGFTLSGLDIAKYYSFSVFSSRAGVNDNRETLYTVTGSTISAKALNPANNTSNTADILNIQANASGEITFEAKPGPNNNNGSGFYYLGAIQFIVSDTPITDTTPSPQLTLNYPNGGHLWEVGKTVRIKWESISVPNMGIEISADNGSTWSTIATVPGSQQYYDMVVPNNISTDCLIRISGESLNDTSDASFEIMQNNNVVYKIVVLGSSTAAGTGPSDINDAWVWKYRTYLTEMDTRYEVVNLALGGYATYNVLPTGTIIPAGVNRTINTDRNITKAIDLQANGIIINIPSNDAASGYPAADQINNYNLINTDALAADIPLWVTTPQPRNFGTNTTNLNIQLQMITETNTLFGTKSIDFWTGFQKADNNGILPLYDAGDGIHMNSNAHQILYDRIIAKNIHIEVKYAVDATLNTSVEKINDFIVFPNPISQQATIKFNQNVNERVTISIINLLGQELENQTYKVENQTIYWDRKEFRPGIYFMSISYESKFYKRKIIIN